MMVKEGCAYGKVNRVMIEDMKETIHEVKNMITGLDGKVTDLFNHQSSRVPPWATFWIAFLSSIAVGAVVALIK